MPHRVHGKPSTRCSERIADRKIELSTLRALPARAHPRLRHGEEEKKGMEEDSASRLIPGPGPPRRPSTPSRTRPEKEPSQSSTPAIPLPAARQACPGSDPARGTPITRAVKRILFKCGLRKKKKVPTRSLSRPGRKYRGPL